LAPDRLEDPRMSVPENQRGVVAGKIEQSVTIDVGQPTLVTFLQNYRIRRMEEGAARVGAGKILAALLVVFVRGWGQAKIEFFLPG